MIGRGGCSYEASLYFETKLRFEVDCRQVWEALHRRRDLVVIDVRDRPSFDDAHVPGAINVPNVDFLEERLKCFGTETEYVTYGEGAHCNLAVEAALKISQAGYRARLKPAGILGWTDAHLPLATAAVDARPRSLIEVAVTDGSS